MLPFRFFAALGQEVHGAHEIAGVEILRVHPRQELHALVFRSQRGFDPLGALPLHVREEAADEIGQEIGAQRPAGAKIAEHPEHVRHAGEHHAAVGNGVCEDERLAVDLEGDVPEHVEIEAGGGDDDVRFELSAGFQQDALRRECVDFVSDNGRLAGADAAKDVAVRHEGDALAPGPVVRREMGLDVESRAQVSAHAGDQFLLHRFRILESAPREGSLVVQNLAAHDLVNPYLVDL